MATYTAVMPIPIASEAGRRTSQVHGSAKNRRKAKSQQNAREHTIGRDSIGRSEQSAGVRSPAQAQPESATRRWLGSVSLGGAALAALVVAARFLAGKEALVAERSFCAADLHLPGTERLLQSPVAGQRGSYAVRHDRNLRRVSGSHESTLTIEPAIERDFVDAALALRRLMPQSDLLASLAAKHIAIRKSVGAAYFDVDQAAVYLRPMAGTLDCAGKPHAYVELVAEELGHAEFGMQHPKTAALLLHTPDRSWQIAEERRVRVEMLDAVSEALGTEPRPSGAMHVGAKSIVAIPVRDALALPQPDTRMRCSDRPPLALDIPADESALVIKSHQWAQGAAAEFGLPDLVPILQRHFEEHFRYAHPAFRKQKNVALENRLNRNVDRLTTFLVCLEDAAAHAGLSPRVVGVDKPLQFIKHSINYRGGAALTLTKAERLPVAMWKSLCRLMNEPRNYRLHPALSDACDSLRILDIDGVPHVLSLAGSSSEHDALALIRSALNGATAARAQARIILDLQGIDLKNAATLKTAKTLALQAVRSGQAQEVHALAADRKAPLQLA